MSDGGRRGVDWLCEDQTTGVRLCLRLKERLVRRRTAFQQLELVDTAEHGRVLALDGKVMLSERDEPFYHEMLVHPAMFAHPAPRRVLVVGGGDGGTLREVLRHPSVEQAVLVEIDAEVVEVCREHLQAVHQGAFDDPRTQVVVAPGEGFMPRQAGTFDVILVDSTDPIGPGQALFTTGFFRATRRALREGGLVAMQAGTPFYWPHELTEAVDLIAELFPHLGVYLGFVPTYPAGMWAYVLAGLRDVRAEGRHLAERFAARGVPTRYYTPHLHRAAFTLPRFLEELLPHAAGGHRP
ncbi:MAG: polyamine aminopropyltransferase [Candidatus Bipolaricaulaceae bacterium]